MKPRFRINNELPSFGRYYGKNIGKPFTNSIEINLKEAKRANLIMDTIRHELIHAVLDGINDEENICLVLAGNFDNISNWSEEFYQLCLKELVKEEYNG